MSRSWLPTLFGDAPLMRGPAGSDPFLQMQQQMNRFLEDAVRGFGLPAMASARAMATPRLNVSETDDAIRIEAELPGVAADDIRVELADDVITIRGEKRAEREDKDESYHVMERSYGAFALAVRLPFAVRPEQVQATFRNGVLAITVLKSAARENVRRIQVKGGGAETVTRVDRAAADDKPNVGEPESAPDAGEAQAAAHSASNQAAR